MGTFFKLIITFTWGCMYSLYWVQVQGFDTGRVMSAQNNLHASCPCANPKWCEPLKEGKAKTEVFAFSVMNKESHWIKYDWNKLTTVVQGGYANASLVCLAHSHNVRVVTVGAIGVETMTDSKARKLWIQKQLTTVQENFFDGVNFDFENVIEEKQSDLRKAYTQTVMETAQALKAISPHYQISVDVAWMPNVDSRYYDYKGLSQAADLLFVMAYDEQSQIHGECLSLPNSGLQKTMTGLQQYLANPDFQVDPKKLVLGLPWYGYIYPCVNVSGDNCFIKKVPFRGVPCSDAAGKQYDLSYINVLLKTLPNPSKWNSTSSTPFFTVENTPGVAYQVQFDNAHSLSLKYALAQKKGLRGVGMWNIDSLDYSDTMEGEIMRKEMFGALP